MGCVWSFLCCCCGSSGDKKDKQSPKKPTKGPIVGTHGTDVKPLSPAQKVFQMRITEDGTEAEEEKNNKKPTPDKIKAEIQKSPKPAKDGGAYSQRKAFAPRARSQADFQYNEKGLIDAKAPEFETVRRYLAAEGYTLKESIGSGNYAEVYKASKDRKSVAVKVINLKKADKEEKNYRKAFLPNEIKTMSQCKHKNIIKMYQINQSSNRIFMVMELAPYGTLADWLRDKGALTEPLAHTMYVPIVEAIHYMHSNRIAHRDLKLENILITRDYVPKLSDFSYAIKYNEGDPKSTTYCGSLPYFSPEILQRQPLDPLISDIWSLGVCFFIGVSDTLPFKLGDDAKMLDRQLTRNWRFKTSLEGILSVAFKQLIAKMLEPDITLRITSAQLMTDPWIVTNK